MKNEELMFILTFMFGVMEIICLMFKVTLCTITELFISKKVIKTVEDSKSILGMLLYIIFQFIDYCGALFTYFAIGYQVWFWFIYKLQIIK